MTCEFSIETLNTNYPNNLELKPTNNFISTLDLDITCYAVDPL